MKIYLKNALISFLIAANCFAMNEEDQEIAQSVYRIQIRATPDFSSIRVLQYFNHLKRVNLRGCARVRDWHYLSDKTTLRYLNLEGVFIHDDMDYPSLDFLAPLVNLKYLKLGLNDHIFNIAPITHLPNLKVLDLHGNKNIQDWHTLYNLPKLESLSIQYSNVELKQEEDPYFLSFLNYMPNFRELTVSDKCDTTHLDKDKILIHVFR